jgi:hypothetical protein
MQAWKLAGIVAILAFVAVRPAAAQPPPPRGAFVDGSVMADIDSVDYATEITSALGLAVGWNVTDRTSFRFELERPAGQPALAVAPTVRTTYSVLFGRHFQPIGRLRFAVVVGATRTDQRYLGLRLSDGDLAATAGGDAEIAVTRHLSLVPGVRVHYILRFGYYEMTSGKLERPRVALRWRF